MAEAETRLYSHELSATDASKQLLLQRDMEILMMIAGLWWPDDYYVNTADRYGDSRPVLIDM